MFERGDLCGVLGVSAFFLQVLFCQENSGDGTTIHFEFFIVYACVFYYLGSVFFRALLDKITKKVNNVGLFKLKIL